MLGAFPSLLVVVVVVVNNMYVGLEFELDLHVSLYALLMSKSRTLLL